MRWKILILIFLVGCTSYSSNYVFNPHSGSKGLDVEIMDFTQNEIFVGQEFTMGVKATNRGAEDLLTKLTINTEKGLFIPSTLTRMIYLEGKEKLMSNSGDSQVISFTATSLPIPATKSLETDIFVDACYSYQTKFSAPVCINPDLTGDVAVPSGCPSSTQSFSGGNGAPIVVDRLKTTIKPATIGVIPVFTLSIRNSDVGTVYEKGSTDQACSNKGITKENWGIVDVSSIFLGSDILKCSNNKLKTIESEKGNNFYQGASITCEGNQILESQAYTGVLTATLSYGYKVSTDHKVTIKRTN